MSAQGEEGVCLGWGCLPREVSAQVGGICLEEGTPRPLHAGIHPAL